MLIKFNTFSSLSLRNLCASFSPPSRIQTTRALHLFLVLLALINCATRTHATRNNSTSTTTTAATTAATTRHILQDLSESAAPEQFVSVGNRTRQSVLSGAQNNDQGKLIKSNTNKSNSSDSLWQVKKVSLTQRLSSRSSNSNNKNKSTNEERGDFRGAASLLRPSFFRGLLAPHRQRNVNEQQAGAGSEGEDEEEVTQTIVVPLSATEQQEHEADKQQLGSIVAGRARPVFRSETKKASLASSLSHVQQPNAEASLRLTSTEIGGLLNDREAPEFYRERELNGDGVLVGEEPPSSSSSLATTGSSRLGMAASGQFGSGHFPGGGGGEFSSPFNGMGATIPSGFESSLSGGGDINSAAMYRNRLAQAASEEAFGGNYGGFNHRFGHHQSASSFGAGDELAGRQYSAGGGLMQSPNEYSEVNSYNAAGLGAGFTDAVQHQHFGGGGGGNGALGGDFSPHSGLLRAGSEGGSYGAAGGLGMLGGGGGLETAAAYSGNEFSNHGGVSEFGQGNFYGGGAAGRLQAHASFNPYQLQATASSDGEYSSRFGQNYGGGAGMGGGEAQFGLDQRGFASQNSHSIVNAQQQQQQQQQHQRRQHSHGATSPAGRGLLPLTPVVPLMDELAVTRPSVLSSNQRGVLSSRQQQRQPSHVVDSSSSGRMQATLSPGNNQQVHEALEDDPTDVSGDETFPSGQQQHYENGNEGEQQQDGLGAPTTMSSSTSSSSGGVVNQQDEQQQQQQFARQAGNGEHSLVLNVPPPSSSSSLDERQHARGSQMVEFSRVGSAGYLGPSALSSSTTSSRALPRYMLAKKSGRHMNQRLELEQIEAGSGESDFGSHGSGGGGASSSSSSVDESTEVDSPSGSTTGADNPAHAGKYIID